MCGLWLESKTNTDMCAQCGKWILIRCAGVWRAIQNSQKFLHRANVRGNFGEAVEQEVKLCDEVEIVRDIYYIRYIREIFR